MNLNEILKSTKYLLLLACLHLHAQPLLCQWKAHFKAIGKGEQVLVSKETIANYAQDPQSIQALDKYLGAKEASVQREAVRLTGRIGAAHSDTLSRQRAVQQLLLTAQTAPSPTVEKIAKQLQKFVVNDFDETAQSLLFDLIKAKRPHLDEYIKLAGFLQKQEQLESLLADYEKPSPTKQIIGLALIRSGDEAKLEKLLTIVKEMPIDDDFTYRVAPLLVYVRQKPAMDYLLEVVLNDEKNCHPAGPDVGGKILCGYRILEAIAPYIKDFPVTVGASGDLEVEDYRQAMKTVREWIALHQEDYELRVDIY